MKVNKNDPNISTTFDVFEDDVQETPNWNINEMYKSDFSVNELVDTLKTLDKFKRKYPNDDLIQGFDEIIRNEICNIFGGSIYDNTTY